jgi:hypothetical protein
MWTRNRGVASRLPQVRVLLAAGKRGWQGSAGRKICASLASESFTLYG